MKIVSPGCRRLWHPPEWEELGYGADQIAALRTEKVI